MGIHKLRMSFLILLSISAVSSFHIIKSVSIVNETLPYVYDRGYLIIGSDTTYPPFEHYNSTSRQYEGFDIDLAHQIANYLGVQLKVETSAWDPIISNLKSGDFDVILSAMLITPEGEIEVDFTRWYYKAYQAILVEDGNPLEIMTEADLNAEITIGVQSGTRSDFWVQENLDNIVTLHTFDSIFLAIAALKQGTVDVVLGNYPILAQDELKSGETEIAHLFAPQDFGIACRDGDFNLRIAIDDALDSLLGPDPGYPEPTDLYNSIYYKWFGISARDLGYTGNVIDKEIPYFWYEEPSTTTTTDISTTRDSSAITTDPIITPGFSVFMSIYVFPIIFWYQKKKNRIV